MKRTILLFLTLALLCIFLTACVPTFSELMGDLNKEPTEETVPEYEKKLREVVDLLDKVYVDGYETEDLGDYLAEAAVEAAGDRWSYYISADEYASYLEDSNNEYVGIGVTVRLVNEDDEGITVMEVNRGGSAHEAGILPGDMIISVDGQNAVTIGVDEMSNLIRGKEGTELTLTVKRDGQLLEMKLIRKLIEIEVVSYENLDGIGYIKIENFQAHCAERTIQAIEDLNSQGVRGLIFDLRFNPGGRKTELCKVLDYLLPEGPLFRAVDYRGEESIDYSSGDSLLELPMVVMVNQDSYSAAEFFAAAMQEYEWATVVGVQTVGKGNYQQTFPMSDGSAIAISTGHYSTPNGVNLEGVGITPDVVVEVDQELYIDIYLQSISPSEDPQLQAALEQFQK